MKKKKLSIITGSILAFVLIGGLYQNCGSNGKKKSLTSGSTSGSQVTSGSTSGLTAGSTSTSGNTGTTGVNTSINTSVNTSVNTTVNTSVGISTTNTSTTFNTTVNTTASTAAATSGSTSGGGGPNPNSPVCPHYSTFEPCVKEVIETARAKVQIDEPATACNDSYEIRKKYKNPNYVGSEICVNIFRRINPEGTANPVPCFTVKDPDSCAGSCWRFTGYYDGRPVPNGLGRPEKAGTPYDDAGQGQGNGGRFHPFYDPIWLNMGGSGVESATPDDGVCGACPLSTDAHATDPNDTPYLYWANKKANANYMNLSVTIGMKPDPTTCCPDPATICAKSKVQWVYTSSTISTYPNVNYCPGTKPANQCNGVQPDPTGAQCGPWKSNFANGVCTPVP